MSTTPNNIADLTEEAAIHALETAASKYLELCGVAIPVVTAMANTLFEAGGEETVALAESGVAERGAVAKKALTVMIESGDPLAVDVSETAVQQFSNVQEIEPITVTLTGSYLLALAVVSKISYNSKRGWSLQPGFPGLSAVLEKAGKLVSAAIGPGASGTA
jgi:hypothetical protein